MMTLLLEWDDKVNEAIKTKRARFRSYKALVKAGRLAG